MGRGGNTGVRSSQQAQQASTRLLCLRCSGPLPEQSKLLAGGAGAEQAGLRQTATTMNTMALYSWMSWASGCGWNTLTNAFPKFLESHGLRRMRFHDLRHSCASLLLANGVPPQTHSGVVGAQRLYHHGEHLRPLGLQVQDHFGAGDGDRACSAGGRRLQQPLEFDQCRGEQLIFSSENRKSCGLCPLGKKLKSL